MNERIPASLFHVRMRLQWNERVHKVFIIHNYDHGKPGAPSADFRILTKELANGAIELIAYTYWFDGVDEHQSDIVRAPEVPPRQLTSLIRRVVEQSGTDIRQMEVLDLTTAESRMDQADRLAQHDLLDAFDFDRVTE